MISSIAHSSWNPYMGEWTPREHWHRHAMSCPCCITKVLLHVFYNAEVFTDVYVPGLRYRHHAREDICPTCLFLVPATENALVIIWRCLYRDVQPHDVMLRNAVLVPISMNPTVRDSLPPTQLHESASLVGCITIPALHDAVMCFLQPRSRLMAYFRVGMFLAHAIKQTVRRSDLRYTPRMVEWSLANTDDDVSSDESIMDPTQHAQSRSNSLTPSAMNGHEWWCATCDDVVRSSTHVCPFCEQSPHGTVDDIVNSMLNPQNSAAAR